MTLNARIVHISLLVLLLLAACSPAPVPKPRSFFRIDMPEKSFRKFENGFPYSFEYPAYANVMIDPSPTAEPWWINIDIPRFKARIHLSYKSVDNNLHEYLDDTHKLLTKHIAKATGIREDIIVNEEENVYGIIYNIRGTGVASTCQFYVTDSTRHFLRGALYFNVVPNNDSLAPVIEFLKEDIQHMVMTLQWKSE